MARSPRLLLASAGTLAALLAAMSRPGEAMAQAVSLPGSVLVADPAAQVAGSAEPSAIVSFQVALRLRNRTDLDARVGSGERLSAAELAARHLPDAGAYRAVRDWLTGQGLTIDRDTDDRLMIEAHGTAAQVGAALGIGFARVTVGGRSYVAAQQAPSVPASVAPYVESINGLQPYQHMNPVAVAPSAAAAATGGVSPAITISGDYYPDGILRAYKSLPYLTDGGSGTRTAILIDTLPIKTDLTQFWSLTSISQSLSNIELINVPGGTLPASSIEDSLDAEWASSIGYQSKVRVYAAGSLAFTALDTAMHRILSDIAGGLSINQLSISLGACETAISSGQINTDNGLLESIAAQGVTILVASGDDGAHECGSGAPHPSFYSTSPYVTAVGGTSLVVTAKSNTAPKVTIKSETGWSGSGGGISTVFAKPSYQSSLSYAKRAVPDVAAVADPNTGVVYVLNGETGEIGGTSVATPIWAGFVAEINQARLAAGLAELGALGPRLYPLVGTANLRDITKGNNGYAAGKGYDLVTGFGSPVMNQLLPTLVAQP